MSTAVVVLVTVASIVVVLLLLGVGAVLLDRVSAARAERVAADHLSAQFGAPATVRVYDRPFLPQALRGRYGRVDVQGVLSLGDITGASLVAHLHNVYLPMRAALAGRVTELPCEHVQGRLILPYAELARVARIPGLTLAFEGERLLATATLPAAFLPVPGLGQLTRVSGHAELRLGGGGSVWLRIRNVSVAGFTLPSVVLSQLLPALDVPIPFPPLPFGLRLDEVRPTASGVVVDGSADAVVFRRAPVSAQQPPDRAAPQPSPAPRPGSAPAGSSPRPSPSVVDPSKRDKRLDR